MCLILVREEKHTRKGHPLGESLTVNVELFEWRNIEFKRPKYVKKYFSGTSLFFISKFSPVCGLAHILFITTNAQAILVTFADKIKITLDTIANNVCPV